MRNFVNSLLSTLFLVFSQIFCCFLLFFDSFGKNKSFTLTQFNRLNNFHASFIRFYAGEVEHRSLNNSHLNLHLKTLLTTRLRGSKFLKNFVVKQHKKKEILKSNFRQILKIFTHHHNLETTSLMSSNRPLDGCKSFVFSKNAEEKFFSRKKMRENEWWKWWWWEECVFNVFSELMEWEESKRQ